MLSIPFSTQKLLAYMIGKVKYTMEHNFSIPNEDFCINISENLRLYEND